jgi:predicted nucleic acid-binding protein
MADAFLLDTNILINLLNPRNKAHQTAWGRLHAVPQGSHIAVSTIALAEVDVGCCLGQTDIAIARQEITDLVQHNGFLIEPITRHTAPYYGELRAKLIKKYQPKRARWPERWKDKVTGADLGVDEPDLIMVAQSLQHGYVFVTNDEMSQIRDGLKLAGIQLNFQDWTVASIP